MSIYLGTSLISGASGLAGGAPINSVLTIIGQTGNTFIDANSDTWLRTGVFETDLALYPDAFTSPNGVLSLGDSIPAVFSRIRNITWNNDGTKMFLGSSDAYREYTLTTPYEITSATLTTTSTVGGAIASALWNDDGTMFWNGSSGIITTRYFTFTSAFDFTTATEGTFDFSIFPVQAGATAATPFKFSPDGSVVYVHSGNSIVGYNVPTVYDLNSIPTTPVEAFNALLTADDGSDFDLSSPTISDDYQTLWDLNGTVMHSFAIVMNGQNITSLTENADTTDLDLLLDSRWLSPSAAGGKLFISELSIAVYELDEDLAVGTATTTDSNGVIQYLKVT